MKSGGSIEEKIRRAREEYDAFDPELWLKEGFFEDTGGYLVVWAKRKPWDKAHKNEMKKYRKEYKMGEVFAHNGYRIVMLEEISGVSSPDVLINGVPAEFKRVRNANNIARRARKAVKKQMAQLVLFQIDYLTDKVIKELELAASKGRHGMYFVTGKNKIYEF